MKELILIFSLLLQNVLWAQSEVDETGVAPENPACICTQEVDPVCADNGQTYSNSCMAACDRVVSYVPGACKIQEDSSDKEGTSDSNNDSSSDNETPETNDSNSEEDQGKITRDAKDAPKEKVLMSTIGLVAIGILTPRFVIKCKSVVSAWIAGASATLYVANEVGLASKFKEGSKQKLEAYTKGDDIDKQIESLEQASGHSKTAAKAADTKAKFSRLAGMGFTMAAAVAVAESLPFYPENLKHCTPSSGPTEGTINEVQQFDVFNKSNLFSPVASNRAFQNNIQTSKNDLDAYINFTAMLSTSKKQSPSLKTYNELRENNFFNFNGQLQEVLKITTSFFIPEANAVNMMKLGGLGLGVGLSFLKPVQKVLDKGVTSPYGRAAIFGGFAAVSILAGNENKKAAETFRDRANKYQELATELKEKSTMDQIAKDTVNPYEGEVTMSCIQGGRMEIEVDPTCECLKSKTCKVSEVPKMSGIRALDNLGSIQANTGTLGTISNDLFKGNLNGALDKAENLLENSESMDKLKDSLYDQVNKYRAKEGKSPFDFNNAESSLVRKLEDSISNGVNNLSDEQKDKLAALTNSKDLYEQGGLDAVLNNDSSSNKSAKPSDDFQFDFGFDQKDKNAINDIIEDIDTTIDQNFSDITEDINTDRSESIFQTLERAYKENAYPAFFEEKKED